MVNCQLLFSKYMIRRVPRITLNHWQLTINLSFRAKRRISFLFSTRFLTMFGMTNTVICVRIPCTRYVCPHGAQGLQARYISALSRKGGVSMSAPCLEGWKPDIISFLSLLAWPKSNPKVKASCASHTFARLAGQKIRWLAWLGQPDFLSPCSQLRRLTARGPRTKLIVNG